MKYNLKDKFNKKSINVDGLIEYYSFVSHVLLILFLGLLFFGDNIIEFYSSMSNVRNIGMYGLIFSASMTYIFSILNNHHKMSSDKKTTLIKIRVLSVVIPLTLTAFSSLLIMFQYFNLFFPSDNYVISFSIPETINIPKMLAYYHIFVINIFIAVAFLLMIDMFKKIAFNLNQVEKTEDRLTLSIAVIALIVSLFT